MENDIRYTIDGTKCRLLIPEKTIKGYAVALIYMDEETGEEYDSDVIFVRHIFEEPPTLQIHPRYAHLEATIRQLTDAKSALIDNIRALKEEENTLTVNIAKVKKYDFSLLLDIAEGKSVWVVNEYAEVNEYPKDFKDITERNPLSQAIIYRKDNSYNPKMVLSISTYCDGSGSKENYNFFRTLGEALEFARSLVIEKLNSQETVYTKSYYLKAALANGFSDLPEVQAELKAQEKAKIATLKQRLNDKLREAEEIKTLLEKETK